MARGNIVNFVDKRKSLKIKYVNFILYYAIISNEVTMKMYAVIYSKTLF